MEFTNILINSKSNIFFFCLMFFVAGVALGNFFIFDPFILFCLMLAVVFLLLAKIRASGIIGNINAVIILLLLAVIFGFWRYQIALPDFSDPKKIYHYNGQEIKFIAKIISIDERINLRKLTVETRFIASAKSSNKPISGRVLINTALYPDYEPGDMISAVCQLKSPEPVEDFDYGRYLSKDNIYSVCSFATIKILEQGKFSLVNYIYKIRSNLSSSINSALPEPSAGILNGMLLGLAKNIPDDLNNLFSNLGLTHIIAISGSHITTIAAILMILAIAVGLKRQQAFWPVAIIIIFYIILVGAPASAVRAGVMGILILYGQKIGRKKSIRNLLAFAAAAMLAVNPKILLIDVGFQLSFLSVIGLVYLVPILEKYFRHWPEFFQLKEIMLITVSAQIMTLPLVVYYFGRFSLLSLPANLLILPIIPLLTIWGILNMLTAAVYLPLGKLLGLLSWLMIEYWIRISRLVSKIPLSMNFALYNWLIPVFSYSIIAYWLWREFKNDSIMGVNRNK